MCLVLILRHMLYVVEVTVYILFFISHYRKHFPTVLTIQTSELVLLTLLRIVVVSAFSGNRGDVAADRYALTL